jgi:hypothetical protein
MLRIGVTPVPVAIISEGVALPAGRVKKPWGPMNSSAAPGSTA